MQQQHPAEGGSYVIEPDGTRRLVERTKGEGRRAPVAPPASGAEGLHPVAPAPANADSGRKRR